jgi:hypothetical protein
MGVVFRPADAPRPGKTIGDRLDSLGFMVDEVVEAEYRIGVETARRAQAIERARKYSDALANEPASGKQPTSSSMEMARRAFVCEIGAALRIPDRTAERLIKTSETLVNELPSTLLALAEGRLGYRHAQILVDNSYGLDREAVRELETRMLPVAQKNTPSRFEQSVRKTRERLNPESMVERHVTAVAERGTELVPEQDGMVFYGAHLGAVAGVAIDNRITAIARSLQCDNELRTLTQLKADVFADILLDTSLVEADGRIRTTAGRGADPAFRYRSIRPTVLVTVPAMTLLGRNAASGGSEAGPSAAPRGTEVGRSAASRGRAALGGTEPGAIEGYGPIDPATARQVASFSKTFRRMLTDPVTGVVLAFDRKRYRIPKDLRTWLRVRDGTCRFPGCNRRAGPCEIDHTEDWALGGGTNHDNLAHLCKKHHTIKGASTWTVVQLGGGRLRWTSPARIPYDTDPETQIDPPAMPATKPLDGDKPPF